MFNQLKEIYEKGKPNKLINKKYKYLYDFLLENTLFLDNQCINKDYHIKITQRLYHLINNIKKIPICKICDNLVEFSSYRTYRIYCSNKCKVKDADYDKRLSKGKQTKKEKYGDENYSNWEKGKQTCLEKYGVTNNLWIKEVRDNIIKNNIEKYGVKHHAQSLNYEQSFNNKKYHLPSGKIITIQGYENLALDLLLTYYNEEDIIVGKHNIFKQIGKLEYIYDNKIHTYFPDIFIKSKNLIIEVKSEWTYKFKKEISFLKKQACLNKDYNFEFWIFGRNKPLNIL